MGKKNIHFLLFIALFFLGCQLLTEPEPEQKEDEISKQDDAAGTGDETEGTEDETEETEGNASKDEEAAGAVACGDITDEQKKKGDELVAKANASGIESIKDMIEELDEGEWDKAKKLGPSEALALYEEALEEAPGHCEARFGRMVANLAMVVEDPELDKFVKHMEEFGVRDEEEETVEPQLSSARNIMATPIEGAPGLLMKAAVSVKKADPLTVTEIQDLAEKVLLPRVESSIKDLEAIIKQESFSFEFTVEKGTRDEKTIQLDLGEIGPMLAGAKVLKAYLLVVLAHNLEPLHMDGSLQWLQDIEETMDDADFKNLTEQQNKIIEHLKGLTSVDSKFLSKRESWKKQYEAIPDLLLEAIGHLQTGLEYGLKEADEGEAGQKNDPYIVGKGPNADVDPADFKYAIENLEKTKKYLKDEPVTITYAKGQKKIRVHIRKFFAMDNYQKYGPYFKFYPTGEWEDVVREEIEWTREYGWEAVQELYRQMGYKSNIRRTHYNVIKLNPNYPMNLDFMMRQFKLDSATAEKIKSGELVGSYFQAEVEGAYEVVANLTRPVNSCQFHYRKVFEEEWKNQQSVVYNPVETTGDFTLENCRVRDDVAEFADWRDTWEKGPIYFTDPDGNKSFEPEVDGKDIDSPKDLKGKIHLRDYTLGGIFPDLNKDNFWETLDEVVDKGGPKLEDKCYQWSGKQANSQEYRIVSWNRDTNIDYWNCEVMKPGVGASDLDILFYYIESLN